MSRWFTVIEILAGDFEADQLYRWRPNRKLSADGLSSADDGELSINVYLSDLTRSAEGIRLPADWRN